MIDTQQQEEYFKIKEGLIDPKEAISLSQKIVNDVWSLESRFTLMPEGNDDKFNHLLTKFRINVFSAYAQVMINLYY